MALVPLASQISFHTCLCYALDCLYTMLAAVERTLPHSCQQPSLGQYAPCCWLCLTLTPQSARSCLAGFPGPVPHRW
jgi:hypothetical protein